MNDVTIHRVDSPYGGDRFYRGFSPEGVEVFCFPSVTTILDGAVPKDQYLIRWIREQGIGGQAIFEQAGKQGTEVHVAIETLLEGGNVPVDDNMPYKVKKCLQAFIDWHNDYKPETLETEQIVFNMNDMYAGGCDYVCKIGGEVYVIDWKTSTSIVDKHLYQVAAYRKALEAKYPGAKTAIVHLGNKTKKKYSMKEFDWEPEYEKFAMFNNVWRQLNPGAKPKENNFPDVFELQTSNED